MISTETKDRVSVELLTIQVAIEQMEATTPHDELPDEYDDLIRRRNAAIELLGGETRKR